VRPKKERYPETSEAENRMTRYAIVVEKGAGSYGAYVPDLPGCVAAANTRAEVLQLIREAIEFHIDAMPEDGLHSPRAIIER
jgi:predicted RNase H-like HicB family nuclease